MDGKSISRKHHTKNKGDIGSLKARVRLAELGFTILIPISEHEVFDFVVYKDSQFTRVQAKYRSLENGVVTVPLKTSWADRHGSHIKYLDKEEIDLMTIYCPDTEDVYFVNPSQFENKNAISLRVEPPKNNQRKNVLFAKDFLSVP